MGFRRYKRWVCLLLAGAVALALIGLAAYPSRAQVSRAFSVDRLQTYQLANLDWAAEVALGEAIDGQLKQDGLTPYRASAAVVDYVNQVGGRVVAASSQSHYTYTFQLVDDDSLNAFATIGGYVYIHTGLLKVIQNEAELAGVLAHEVGHIEEQDGLNHLWHQLMVQQLGLQVGRRQQPLVALGGQLRSLSNSHTDEYIADAIAFHILGQADYAQGALISLLQRIDQSFAQAVRPGFISSHPNPRRRIQQLQQRLRQEQTPTATAGLDPDPYAAWISALD